MSDTKPKQAAVVDGVPQYTSVSALQKADGCLRQWYYRYVERLPDKEPGKGQIRGTQGHDRIDKYLKTGTNILDPLELKGMKFMPPVGSGYFSEEHFGSPTPLYADGIPMTGYMDLVDTRALNQSIELITTDIKTKEDVVEVVEPGTLIIKDWKFKKSIDDWGCSADDLVNPHHEAGIQMLGYAAWARQAADRFQYPVKRVRLSHVTFQTQGKAKVEETAKTHETSLLKSGWETVSLRIVPRIRAAAKATTAYEVPKNTDICEKYGGCAFKTQCLSRMARVASNIKQLSSRNKGEAKMGMLGSVLNTNTQSPIRIDSGSPAAPSTPKAPIIQDLSTPGEIKAKDAKQMGKYRVGAAIATFLCNVGDTSTFLPVAGGQPIAVPGTQMVLPVADVAPAAQIPLVLPSDAPKSDPALAAKVDAAPTSAVTTATPAPAPATPSATTPAEPPAQAPAVATAPSEPAKKTRAKKTEPAQASIEPVQPSSTTTGAYLYFGCSPVGVATQTLSQYAEAIEAQTIKDGITGGVQGLEPGDDIRTATDQVFGFGKWKGWISSSVKQTPLPPGHYIVMPGDERIDCIAQTLTGLLPAGHVVMGGGR